MRKLAIFLVMIGAIAVAFVFYKPGSDTAETDVVTISSGDLTGVIDNKTDVVSFKGVPYAAAPVGDRRWAPPAAAARWDGVFKADTYGPACIQQTDGQGDFIELMMDGVGMATWRKKIFSLLVGLLFNVETSEDCLTLAVWTPAEIDEPLPVMVWYHGGGHRFGAGESDAYPGTELVQHDVILVSINYRLGILGFFTHPELSAESAHGVSGNYGTLDQIHALEWVEENIAAFGGDPDNVTIFGESAGAHSIGQVMASPLSEGLLHRAIAQSGIGTHQFLTLKPSEFYPVSAEEVGARFAASIDITGDDQLSRLRALDANELNDAFMAGDWDQLSHPVVDGYVFPKSVAELFASGQQARILLMIGTNADEGTLLAPLIGSPFSNQKLTSQTPEAYEALVRENYGDRADEVLALYPATSQQDLQDTINDLFGDHFFGMQAWFTVNEVARQSPPAYLYFFTRTSPSPDQWAGAYHGADLQFIFGNFFPLFPKNDFDETLADQMMDYWTSFATTGDPNGAGGPEWSAFDPASPEEMELGARVGMRPVERADNYQLLISRQMRMLEALAPEPSSDDIAGTPPVEEGE